MRFPVPTRQLLALVVAPLLFTACSTGHSIAKGEWKMSPCPSGIENDGVQSYDLVCREPVSNHTRVKHILIGWKELATPTHPVDPRAANRTYAQARELALSLLAKLRGGEAIDPLMKEYSEDAGSAQSGMVFDVRPDSGLVPSFKALGLRLNVGEAGIVQSEFGLHVIQRVE